MTLLYIVLATAAGGLLSVAKGQSEAGHALSFSFIGIQRLIVIP